MTFLSLQTVAAQFFFAELEGHVFYKVSRLNSPCFNLSTHKISLNIDLLPRE